MSPDRPRWENGAVRDRRIYAAGIVLGVAVAVAVWLFTYQVSELVEHIEYIGGKRHSFQPSERVSVQPWWAVPASLGAVLVGGAISFSVLPGGRGVVRRLADHFAALAERSRGRANGLAK
jgi:hypothetical protein